MTISRRDLLRLGLMSPMAWQLQNLIDRRVALAQTPDSAERRLVNVLFNGGPDFRHLFPAAYDANASSVGYAFWNYRNGSYQAGGSPGEWQGYYNSRFTNIAAGSTYNSTGQSFGILNSCGWLVDQWNAGNVAIINNVVGSENRDHQHSQLMYEAGDVSAGKNDLDRDGWGGRLADALSANVVSLTSQVKQFCYGPDAGNPTSHSSDRIVPAADTRNMGLYQSNDLQNNADSQSSRAVLERGLNHYYTLKSAQLSSGAISGTSPWARFIEQDTSIKSFSASMNARLSSFPIPDAIQALYTTGAAGALNDTRFGRQIRNLHDAYIAWDLLSFRIASMELGGWDTHRQQLGGIEENFVDLFGPAGAMAQLQTIIQAQMPLAWANSVFCFGGEFGRQLKSNGDLGTDHGTGMTILLIGENVNGGVYGDMYPASELVETRDNTNNYSQHNSHILGRTSIYEVFGQVCDHVTGSSTGDTIFTNRSSGIIETAGMFDNLFSS